MSLIRRRALLAASMQSGGGGGTYDEFFGNIPPESTTFEFPLYITVPFVSIEEYGRVYEKQGDIVNQLVDWFFANADVYEDRFYISYELYEPDIYINGEKIECMFAEKTTYDEDFYYITCMSQRFDNFANTCDILLPENKFRISVG